jgi:hypothetical protein
MTGNLSHCKKPNTMQKKKTDKLPAMAKIFALSHDDCDDCRCAGRQGICHTQIVGQQGLDRLHSLSNGSMKGLVFPFPGSTANKAYQ